MLKPRLMFATSSQRSHLNAALVMIAIAFMGLPSCSSNTSVSPASTETATASNAQATIKAGSGSATANILRILKTAYTSTAKNTQITLLEPSQSPNMIAGVKQGLADIGFINRILKPEENDGTLAFREVARDALMVATHPSVTGVKKLTTANLKAIYSGSITNWKQLGGPDATIVLLDRPEDESAKRLLREHYLGKDLPNAPNAVLLRKEEELIQTLQSTPYSIGAFSLAYAISHNLPANRLSLNDIAPTVENLKAGKYLMYRQIGIVSKQNPSEATQSFLTFISSPSGIGIIEQSGFATVTPAESKSK